MYTPGGNNNNSGIIYTSPPVVLGAGVVLVIRVSAPPRLEAQPDRHRLIAVFTKGLGGDVAPLVHHISQAAGQVPCAGDARAVMPLVM